MTNEVSKFSAIQSDVIFNYYGLAFDKDNQGIKIDQKAEGDETKLCLTLLVYLFESNEDDIRQEYQARL
jgi:hypothetical protein